MNPVATGFFFSKLNVLFWGFFWQKMDILAGPVTEETQTPCSCSNRSLTLPQATGKTPMSAWEGLRTYASAWVAGNLCVRARAHARVRVSLTGGQETLTGSFACSILFFHFFWSLDQKAHHLTATAVRGTRMASTHTCLCMRAHTRVYTHAHTQARWLAWTLARD